MSRRFAGAGLRRNVRMQGARRSRAVPWTPADATSAELRSLWHADTLTLSASEVTGVADLSGNGNDLVVPSIAGITGPTYEATGWRGKPSMLFDGVDDGLIRSTFSFGAVGIGYTWWVLAQRVSLTSSVAIMGYQNARPFIRTFGVDGGVSWSGDAAGSSLVGGDGSTYGPSLIVGRFDPVNDIQSLWIDGVKVDEDGNTDPGSGLDGGSIGLGFGGHPTTFDDAFNGRVRAAGIYRGPLSDAEIAKLAAWAEREKTPTTGPVAVIVAGQSNAMGKGVLVDRFAPRRDIMAARDNTDASGPTREQAAWGPMLDTFDSVPARGLDMELMVQLTETKRINAHLFNGAYSGIGFEKVGSVDLWIPPSSNGGVGGEMYNRLVALINDTRAAQPAGTARQRTWLVWCHGETDALSGSATAGRYAANLQNFLDDLRADIGEPDLRFACVGLHPDYGLVAAPADVATVRAAMESVVTAYGSNGYLLDMDAQALQADNTHYSEAMHIAIASAVADLIEADL